MTTVGEALWHLMGSNVDDLHTAIGVHQDMPLSEFRQRMSGEVWVYFSYEDGYPTQPLGVYPSFEAAEADLGGMWVYLPQMDPFRPRSIYSTQTPQGVAADLVRFEVHP